VSRRRWEWVEECPEWSKFIAWRDGLAWADRVEVVAGLEMLLDYELEGNTPKVGDDLYAAYTCRKRTIFWVVVAVARPSGRHLLPLAWGTNPSRNLTEAVTASAAERLRNWREAA
jgi:hypothetical protein